MVTNTISKKSNKSSLAEDKVKYNNRLCEVNLGNLSSMGLNLLMLLLLKVMPELKEEDKLVGSYAKQQFVYGPLRATFFYKELRDALNITCQDYSNVKFSQMLKSLNTALLGTICSVEDGSSYIQFQLFPTFETDAGNKTLTVEVNRCFQYLLTDVERNYTTFRLNEFLSLKSKYEKILYMKIRQYRGLGRCDWIDLADAKTKMGIRSDANDYRFLRDIIRPAVENLKTVIPSLEYRPIKSGREHRSTGFSLTFDASKEDLYSIPTLESESSSEPAPKEDPSPDNKKPVKINRRQNQFNAYPQRAFSGDYYEELERRKLTRIQAL